MSCVIADTGAHRRGAPGVRTSRSSRADLARLVSAPPMTDDAQLRRRQHRIGLLYALGAFTAWGVVLPIYLKALADVPVPEILAHRIVWGALFALALVAGLGRQR